MYFVYRAGMLKAKHTATAAELVRQFSHYSDLALSEPVVVTKNGRARNILISVDEYERLKRRDRMAFFAENTPEEFIPQLEALARGEKS
jgi:PHD/YefM family antitoxin component YafN of YafNO toxin-antitoxin module